MFSQRCESLALERDAPRGTGVGRSWCGRHECRQREGGMGRRRTWTCAVIGVAAVSAVVGGCGSAPRSKPGATLTTVATTTVAPTTVVASTDSTTTPASRSVAEPTVVVAEANTSVVKPMTGSTMTVPMEQAPSNRLAVWDVCAVDGGVVRIIDEITGELDTTIGLRGRPVWSHDRLRVASLDNVDGTVRIADVATGQVTTIDDLGLPAYRGDDCGTLGKVVDWAPDDSAVLVSVATYPGDPNQTVATSALTAPNRERCGNAHRHRSTRSRLRP